MGWDGASLATLTSWPVIQPTHTHTTLTIRMHFNFPPCCVHTHRTTYYIAEGGHGRESATSSSSSSSNCCKSAKPQMLSVTQKSTLSSPSLLHTYPTNHPSNKPTAKCSLPFPSHTVHALDAVDKALQFACHLLWQLIVGLPSCQLEQEGGGEGREVDYADSGQLLIKRVENPLCYGI